MVDIKLLTAATAALSAHNTVNMLPSIRATPTKATTVTTVPALATADIEQKYLNSERVPP